MKPFIPAEDVARLIGYRTAHTFLMHRTRLERDEGFPPPLPTSRRPLLWRRDEVEGWIGEVGRTGDQRTALTRGQLRVIEAARTA